MLDVNLGNKTLVVGVLIALILSYGMVNFDSASATRGKGSAVKAALYQGNSNPAQGTTPESVPMASNEPVSAIQSETGLSEEDLANLSPRQLQRELRRKARL